MEERELKKVIEASLFMAPGAVSLVELARIAKTNVAEIRIAVNELIHEFENRDSALEIRLEEQGIRMAVKKELEGTVGHMAAAPGLLKGIMKTLAFISYKQPVKQSEIIRFRNNKAYDHIKVLEDKGFIRREEAGRSYIVFTTKKFLDYFGSAALEKKQGA